MTIQFTAFLLGPKEMGRAYSNAFLSEGLGVIHRDRWYDFIRAARARMVNLFIVDSRWREELPTNETMTAVEAVRAIHSFFPKAVIIALVHDATPKTSTALLDAGATLFLRAPVYPNELVIISRRVYHHFYWSRASFGVYDDGHLRIDPRSRTVYIKGRPAIRYRTRDILLALLSRAPEPYTYTELMRLLGMPSLHAVKKALQRAIHEAEPDPHNPVYIIRTGDNGVFLNLWPQNEPPDLGAMPEVEPGEEPQHPFDSKHFLVELPPDMPGKGEE